LYFWNTDSNVRKKQFTLIVAAFLLTGCLHGGALGGELTGAAADPNEGGTANASEVQNESGIDAPEPYTDSEVSFVIGGEKAKVLAVEVAGTSRERYLGLRNRESLPNGTGMLFAYPSPSERSFTMKDTQVPLDMIFVNGSMRVINIEHAEPDSEFPGYRGESYHSDGPAQYVIETEQGYANDTGLSVGDKLIIRR